MTTIRRPATHWTPKFQPETDDTWRTQAACIGLDHLFFVEQGQTSKPAKAICANCPVIAQCLDYACTHNAYFGIWGGKTDQERKTYKRRRRKEEV